MKVDIIDNLHQPEYTGENRCGPCTVLNLIIAGLLGSLIVRKSKLGGLAAVAISIGLIYLRGYLVPGTPTLTKQYLPPRVLRWFGKNPNPEIARGFGGTETEGPAARDVSRSSEANKTTTAPHNSARHSVPKTERTETAGPEQPSEASDLDVFFQEHGILEPCLDANDLCLTESFETAWFDEIEPLADADITKSEVVEAFGIEADADQFDLMTRDEAHLLRSETGQIGQWPSRPALVADVAASRVLVSWIPDWDSYDPDQKGRLLNSLRMFLETCPTTDEDIEIGEEVVESCCSSHKVVAVTCEESGDRLFEHPLPEDD